MKKHLVLKLLVLIVILIRSIYYFAQPDLSTDHLSQMATAQNFMAGHGFSFKYLDSSLNIFYSTHIQWPPLYPLLIALITFVTANTLLSSFIIQIVALLAMVFIWKRIFNLFENLVSEEAYFYFITLLIISTSVLNNINTILVFSLLLLSLSLYFTFAFIFNNKSKKINLFLSSLFAALLFWTHYSFFFVAFYPAVVLFVIFYRNKDKNILYAAIGSFFINLFVTLGVLIFNYLSTGFINYMDNPHLWDAGFFPQQLLLTDPFFINAFFNSSYIYNYILKTEHNVLLPISLQIISFAILITICVLFLKLRKNKSLPFDKTSLLFVPFFVIIILTITFLLYFTLHYHEIPRPGWTHIGDPRYMSPVYLSIIAIVVLLFFSKFDFFSKKIMSTIKAIFIGLISLNLVINIYISYKEWGNYTFKQYSYIVPNNDLQDLYSNIRREISKGNIPVFIDSDLTVRSFRISQYAGAAVINSIVVQKNDKLSSKLVFFFIMPDKYNTRERDLQLFEWANKFNLMDAGSVYNNLALYKVTNN